MLGSVVAAGLPIVLALVSVGLGLSLLTLAAAVTNFNTITPVLATMLGLGVGIDYALFILTRFRQGIHDGLSGEDAAAAAVATAGRAVVFAGLTVAISISALAVIGLDFITKLGLGAAITVVTAVAAAITLLPAILSLLGPRIDKGRVPFTRRRDAFDRRRRRHRDRALGPLRDPPRPDVGARRDRADRHPGDPGLLGAARLERRGLQPARHDDPPGLRPARRGLRPRLQRPAAGDGGPGRSAGRRRPAGAGLPRDARASSR